MITLTPIATVRCDREGDVDDHWGHVVSSITLESDFDAEALDGIESFSHLEILFYMHKLDQSKICRTKRHPRENRAWPEVGIFAQRGRHRPNQIGLSVAKLLKREGRTLTVSGLDAIDGTPVLDIKPVFREFLPREAVRQPSWVSELMRMYW